jgi:hypothetical protein
LAVDGFVAQKSPCQQLSLRQGTQPNKGNFFAILMEEAKHFSESG